MTDPWANSGLDLHLAVDRTGRRIAASLESALREAVRDGRLAVGTTLPPTRTLAADLGVARNTVAAVYEGLVGEGWLVARQGSATRVADHPRNAAGESGPQDRPVRDPTVHDLRAGFPDVTMFPAREWAAAARAVLASASFATLGYGPLAGSIALRTVLAQYLGRARGVVARVDRMVVTSGFTSALRALAVVLRGRGVTAVGVEAFGHATHRDALATAGLRVVALDVDAHGAVPEGLAGLGAVLLTSAHQFPLGVALAPARRAAFLHWAQRQGALIIEDDYDGEFRYDRRPVGALQPHAPDHVVYAGTVSKTLAPGIGLGWLALPAGLRTAVVEQQVAHGAQPALFGQETLGRLLVDGRYDRQVRRMRAHYRARRRTLVDAVAASGGSTLTGMDAGLHAVLTLPDGNDEDEVLTRCAARGVAVEGLHSYAADGVVRGAAALIVGYGAAPSAHYDAAVARLRDALTSR